MDISCAIVLALMSFVTAVPHEYGAKNGAVAKAEANAVAGSYGVLPAIPLSIPSGSGYSGSFSKSSSSSFSSSSSSASSSSYSFNSNNGIPGVGCSSGTCKSGESNIPPSFNGSPNTQITHHSSEASAVAAAKATAESGYFSSGSNAPCQGCKGLSGSSKCETGQCDRSSDTSYNSGSESGKHTLNSENQQKCLSDNCSPTSKQPDSVSNTNDFEVNFDKNSKTNNPSGNGQTLEVNNGTPSSTSVPKCNSPSCDTFLPLSPPNNAQSFNPQKPDTHLLTPNLRPTCTTHNCNTDSPVPNDIIGKPSSYNVPILGMNPSFQNNVPYNPSVTPLTNIPPQLMFDANCGSNGCTSNNAQGSEGSDGSKTPKYFHSNFPASRPNGGNFGVAYPTQSNIPHSCKTPNCNNFPVPNQSMNPGWSITMKPNFNTAPITPNVPTYNNMFGVAAGPATLYPGLPNMVQPNNYAHHNVPSYSEGPKGPFNSAVHPGLLSTTKPNKVAVSDNQNGPKYTNGFGGPPGPVDAAVYPGTHIPAKPISNIPSTESNLPLYTGGFGGPSGSVTAAVPASTFTTLKPNLNTKPHEATYNSGFGGPPGALGTASTIQHNKPGYTPINTPITLSTVLPNNFGPNNVVNPSGNVNLDLQRPVNEKEKLPPYTGGFGGPSGLLNPNEYNMPSNINSPTPSIPCNSFDCRKNAVSNENTQKAQASASALANAAAVSYSGGFGAPPGFLQPEKSKTENNNSDFKGDNKNNQGNNDKTQTVSAAGGQQNSGVKQTPTDGNTALNDFTKQTNIGDAHSAGSQNNVAGNPPVVNGNKQNNIDKVKEFNDYNQQASIAGASDSAGAQANVGGTSPSVNKNQHDSSDDKKMLEDYFAQANIADAIANAGAQANAGGTFPSVNKNKHDSSDDKKMLEDYFAQANIAGAFANAGAQANVADQDNFIGLTGLNSKQNSGCNSCRLNPNGGIVAGASASSNAGSWSTGQGFASGAATAHAFAGASAKGGYGKR